jgi:hypothetical protein
VRPFTEPQGRYTVAAVTVPGGRSGGVVVGVVPLVPVPPPGGVVVDGTVVVVVASGSADIKLSTPATHADASMANEMRVRANLGIDASVEEDSRSSFSIAKCPVLLASILVPTLSVWNEY